MALSSLSLHSNERSKYFEILIFLSFNGLYIVSLVTLLGMAALIVGVASYANEDVLEQGSDQNVLTIMLMEHLAAILLMGMVYISSMWIVNKLVATRHVRIHKLFETDRQWSWTATADNREDSYSAQSYTSSQVSVSSLSPSSPKGGDNDEKKKKKSEPLTLEKVSKLKFLLSTDQTLDLFMLH